jgi:hypothetical protein
MKRDWRQMAAAVRGAMDRADWTERQRRVASLLVKATLMRGRLAVRVPRLEEFARVTRMSRGNLSEVFSALQLARFCQVQSLDGGGAEYTIQADWRQWDIVELYSAEDQRSFLRDLDAWTGQVQGELLPAEPSLNRALMESGADRAADRCGPTRAPSFPIRERDAKPVPDSGTPLKSLEAFKVESSIELRSLKGLKGIDGLKDAVAAVRDGSEACAVDGMKIILGDTVAMNDGGKWRNRWRTNRDKTRRVFAALAEDVAAGQAHHTGARAEWLWKEFA